MSKLAEGINERLINEYISKVKCCDECFASVYCTVNGLRESRVPQDYCVTNIKSYFGDNANQNIDLAAGDLISRAALKRAIEPYRYAICGFEGILTLIDNAPTVEAYTPDQVKELVDLNKKLSEERSQWLRDAERQCEMGNDLISRSALKDDIENNAEDIFGIEDVIDYIDNAPTIEPQRGEWVKVKEYRMCIDMSGEIATLYKCSECGRTITVLPSKLANYPFCHCGAEMQKGDAE